MKLRRKMRERLNEYRYFADRMRMSGAKIWFQHGGVFGRAALPHDDNGKTPDECQLIFESTGDMVGCADTEEWGWLLCGKQARDWHITEWARGIAECVISRRELRADGVPDTVMESVEKARWRMHATL